MRQVSINLMGSCWLHLLLLTSNTGTVALVGQTVVIEATGAASDNPASPAPAVGAKQSPQPQASPAATTRPPENAAKSNGNDDWIFTPAYQEATPPPLIWGRPDKIREWQIAHGLSSSASANVVPVAHFGGWDPCLFSSKEHPSCLKKGIVKENEINRGHYERRRDMVLLLIVVVVILSIGFDKCHEYMLEMFSASGEKHLVRMVEALMKELTVLGFISLLGAMLIRSGNVGKWSVDWFGTPPKEVAPDHHEGHSRHADLHDVRAGHCISELTVLFEDIHLLIFCIMISLISVAASNMLFLQLLTKTWAEAEDIVKASNGQTVVAIARLVEAHKEASTTTNARIFLRNLKFYERQISYLIHKSEFLHPSGNQPHHNVSVDMFSFYEYLKYCCAEAVTEHMEIPSWIYGTCLVLLLLLRPLFSYQGKAVVCIMVFCSILLALTFLVIHKKMLWIESQLVPKADKIHNKNDSSHVNIDHESLCDLKPVNRLEVKTYKDFVWLRTALCGTCSPSPHEQLFWFHRKGPAFINNSLRLLSFILAIFLGECLNHMISFPYTWQGNMWAMPVILVMSGFALLMYQNCTIKSVTVAATELTPRQDVISHINSKRQQERLRLHKDLLENIKIQAVQRNIFATVSSGHDDWIRRYNELPRGVQRRIHKTWKAFDQDNSGNIDRMELEQCLRSLGKHGKVVEDGSSKWLKALNADEYGEGLTERQFRVMMVAMHEAQHGVLFKNDAVAVLAGLTRHTHCDTCVWLSEDYTKMDAEDADTLYDVQQVKALLFNNKMLSEHHREAIGMSKNYESMDFLQCVLERTQFYGGSTRRDPKKGVTASVSQIAAYLDQLDLEAHPDHQKTAALGKPGSVTWEEGDLVPDNIVQQVVDPEAEEDSGSNQG